MPAPFVTNGKQVLHTVDGLLAPYADAVSISAAEQIAAALTGWRASDAPARNGDGDSDYYTARETVILHPIMSHQWPDGTHEWVPVNMHGKGQTIRGITHRIAQQGDEYACSCGTRWDVTDGEEHP